MSEFHDPELRQQLGRLSGPYPDDNVAFAAWQRRVGQARRRRAMGWTAGAAMSLILGTVAFAAVQSPGRHTLVPGKSSETSSEFTLSVPTTEDDESSSTESSEPETTAPTTPVIETTPSSEVEAESSLPEPEATEAAADQPGTSTKNGHSGSGTSVPATGSQAATQTFFGAGGSITVRQDGDRLTVVAANPSNGFHANEDKQSGSRIQVTFKSDNHQTQISVKLSDGAMKPNVDERGDTHQDSGPVTTSGDGHGGDGESKAGGNSD
jgi:cytoskeletal protein RodZ